jgi:multidrug resistance protein, MATE family
MRKNVLVSYFEGILSQQDGESYRNILRYFAPEFITALVFYSALYLLDARFVSALKSTSRYAVLGFSNNFLHFVIKTGEAMAVSITVLCGKYNGAGLYKKVGKSFVDAFWVIVVVGIVFSAALYVGAYYIYYFLGVTPKMIHLGIPFLRVRALGVLFLFVYLAFVSFLRSLKNTKTPMCIFVLGAFVFIAFDYVLIFGKYGFPELGLLGSAWATTIQYVFMCFLAMGYIFFGTERRQYAIQLFTSFDKDSMRRVFTLSWPMIVDKASIAMAYIWLGKMIAPMGKYAMASYTVIKDMERFAFLPAVAFAQIITFLVSNDFGKENWRGISSNIKKIVFLTSLMVFTLLLILSLFPETFIRLFDHKDTFTAFSSKIFPVLSLFVFFDLLQLILSGALRGAGDVRVVMWTRLIVCGGFFAPLSYLLSLVHMNNVWMKFILIYAMFYVGNALMSIVYIKRFRSGEWARQAD